MIPYITVPTWTSANASDSKWGQPHSIPYGTASSWNVGEAPPVPTVPNWWTPACEHSFVDTGTLKSYCKHCNADAVWCSKELKFKLK